MADVPPGRNRGALTVAERQLVIDRAQKGQRTPGLGTNASPGIIAQARNGINNIFDAAKVKAQSGVRYLLSSVTGATYFGPQQPLPPQAQDPERGAVGRSFDYPFGWNLIYTPRSEDGGVSFWQLRAMAEACDVVRGAIETRKDELEAFGWNFVPADEEADPDSFKAEIAKATAFWSRPDGELDWTSWMRKELEDLLVIDAMALWPEKTRGGQLVALQTIDAASIKRLIDDTGRTPAPPDPAYQQILKGFPAVDYTRDDIVYTMRNPRTHKVYGFGPVEQIITTINLALRRTAWQMNYYTQGTIPETIATLPKEWSMDQIVQLQDYMDGLLSGNLAERSKMRFLPQMDKIEQMKSELLKDEFDDYLIRLVCFVFKISPQALMKQMNRAQAQQAADTVKEQGLGPTLKFIEAFVTRVNEQYLGIKGLKFKFDIQEETDPLKQAQAYQIYVQEHVITPDEVRADLGRAALSPNDREEAWPTPVDPTTVLPTKPSITAPGSAAAEEVERVLKRIADASSTAHVVDILRIHGDNLVKAVRAMKPTVVELKPRVSVRVGDVSMGRGPVVHKRTADGAIVSTPADA